MTWGGANRPKTSTKLGRPINREGGEGDVQIKGTALGAKLFAKYSGRWWDIPLGINGVTKFGTTDSDYLSIDRDSVDVFKNDTKVASFGANTTITGGTITLQGTTGTIGHDKLVIGSASIALYTAGDKQIDINDDGINIGPSAVAGTAVIGNVRLGSGGAFIYGAATDDYVNVKSDGVDVYAANVKQAAFGATTTIGNTGAEHVSLSSSGIEIKDNNTEVASFGANTTITGGTITIRNTTNNNDKIVLAEDSLKVYDNNTEVASFGASVVIGEVGSSKSNVQITSGAINLRTNTTTKLSLDSSGNITTKGIVKIETAATDGDLGLLLDNDGTGYNQLVMGGANPEILMGYNSGGGTPTNDVAGSSKLRMNCQNTTSMSMIVFAHDNATNFSLGTTSTEDGSLTSFTDSTCDTDHSPGSGSTFGSNPKIIKMDSTANVKVGMVVSGTGVATGSKVTQIDSGTLFRVDTNTTATNNDQTLTFVETKFIIATGGDIRTGAKRAIEVDLNGDIGFRSTTPAAAPNYTISNLSTDRVLDCNSTSTAELADVLGQLITDLIAMGILQ